MKKKQYIKPLTESLKIRLTNLMITASPGVGGDYDPEMPIDAKSNFFDEDDEEDFLTPASFSLWN
ncbi:MAG: hypothetical protein IJM81_02550 [Prevotella sp.]|nr:hypothetical protein [Prevotella sp.]